MKKYFAGFFIWSLIFQSVPSLAATKVLKLDVVEVSWLGSRSLESSVEQVANSLENSVIPSWERQLDLGRFQGSKIRVEMGEISKSKILLPKAIVCNDRYFSNFLAALRQDIYTNLKITDSQSRAIVALIPNSGCLWLGKAEIGGEARFGNGLLLQDTASPFVINHEVGHLLGLGHSNLLRCSNGAQDGSWSDNCRAIEYGGSIDVMGNVDTDGPLSIYHQWRMGLVDATEVRQSWINETLELNSVNSAGALKGIFLRDGNSAYWVEYRRPTSNQSFTPGLVIYRSDPPPYQFVDSPLPEGAMFGNPGLGVSTDMWMLNLDSYSYSQTGKANGSMTLAPSKSTTLYSGNLTLAVAAGSDPNKVLVTISRKTDSTPPPTPVLKPAKTWTSPDIEILNPGFEDRESAISEFQIRINGKEEQVAGNSGDATVATYLDPFNSRKVLRAKDLPEGEYELSVRSKDVWGNLSSWSNSVKTLIDRSYPLIGDDLELQEFSKNRVKFRLSSFSDKGSGLCNSALVTEEGWVSGASDEIEKPTFGIAANSFFSGNFETFDCLGNGITGSLSLSNQVREVSETKRTGKWSPVVNSGLSGLKCQGKCTLSLSLKDNVSIVSGEGSAEVLVTSKVIQRIPNSTSQSPRISQTVKIGASSKVLRLSGKNFTIYGFVQSKLILGTGEKVIRKAPYDDQSTIDPNQSRLAKFGFRDGDFANSWVLSPMDRGTTLLDPSLDLCSATYKSEEGRQFRRQIIVTKTGSPYLFLSSEVVKYVDKTAGDAAISELQSKFQECVKNKGGVEQGGNFVDYTFSALPSIEYSLVQEGSRVFVRAQIGKGSAARQLLAFYQFKGEMFTGLYVVKSGEVGFADTEVKRWLQVASVMAQRLETKF